MNSSWTIALRFMQRDSYVALRTTRALAFNWGLLVPLIYVFAFGHLMPRVFAAAASLPTDTEQAQSTIIFVGTIILSLLVISFKATLPLLLDLSGQRFIDYQLCLLPPRLIIVQRVLFSTFFTFCLLIPFYPMAKLLLGSSLDTEHTSWPAVYGMLLVSSLLTCSYSLCALCMMKNPRSIRLFWTRINTPLFLLGGFLVPLSGMLQAFPYGGYLSFANPLIYVTEGLRRAFIGSNQFLPVSWCVTLLSLYSIGFIVLTIHFFKKRVDHI